MRYMCSGAGEDKCPRVLRGHTIPAEGGERPYRWPRPSTNNRTADLLSPGAMPLSQQTYALCPRGGEAGETGKASARSRDRDGERMGAPAGTGPHWARPSEPGSLHQHQSDRRWAGNGLAFRRAGETGGLSLGGGHQGAADSMTAWEWISGYLLSRSGSARLPPCFRLLPFDLDDLRRA